MIHIDLLACATCMGAPGHELNLAAGNAIVVMLWALVGIGVMLGGFVWTLVQRQRRYFAIHGVPTAPDPLQEELRQLANQSDSRTARRTRRETAGV